MQAALDRERTILGRGQPSLDRGQISLEIGQLSMDSDGIHTEVASARRSFEASAGSIWEEWRQSAAPCIQAKESGSILPASINAICLGAVALEGAVHARVQLLRQAFDHTAAVWQVEHQRQDNIRRTAIASIR